MRLAVRPFAALVALALTVLTATVPAAAQTPRDTERPVPPLQFGSTASFSGFQFQQSAFGSPLGAPIPFQGIQFPGFGTRYDVSPQDRLLDPTRNVAELFDARFAPSRRFGSSSRTTRSRPRVGWRMVRGDPFEAATGGAASREELLRRRQPFGPVTAESDRRDDRRAAPRSTSAARIATETGVRGGRRRPFFD